MIIAEIGQAHEGSFGMAMSYISALVGSNVDAIKFQIHIAEAESSELEPFRVNFAVEDKSRFDYWKRTSFTRQQWFELKSYCESNGFEFLASPFSIEAFELLEEMGVKRYKLGSGEIRNKLLLDRVLNTGKQLIFSNGLINNEEELKLIRILQEQDVNFVLMQCTTSYPTPSSHTNLSRLHNYRNMNIDFGFSDHSGELYPILAAAALGATYFEFHVVFDKKAFGPDSSSSIEIRDVFKLVKGIRFIQDGLISEKVLDQERNKNTFGKALTTRVNLEKGTKIELSMLETAKPENAGISSSEYKNLIGHTVNKDIPMRAFIQYTDLE